MALWVTVGSDGAEDHRKEWWYERHDRDESLVVNVSDVLCGDLDVLPGDVVPLQCDVPCPGWGVNQDGTADHGDVV